MLRSGYKINTNREALNRAAARSEIGAGRAQSTEANRVSVSSSIKGALGAQTHFDAEYMRCTRAIRLIPFSSSIPPIPLCHSLSPSFSLYLSISISISIFHWHISIAYISPDLALGLLYVRKGIPSSENSIRLCTRHSIGGSR